jgi:vancomycin resistance protein YoaR
MMGAELKVATALDQALAIGDAESVAQRIINGDKPRDVAISIPIELSESASKAWLRQIAHQLNRLPTDAHAFAKKGVGLTIDRPHKTGTRLEMDATWKEVLTFGDGLFDGSEATVVLTTTEPKIRNSDLSPLGTLRSAYFTNYASSSANRKDNLALAAAKLDGHLLQPGEVFSYNDRVGPRTESRGWKTAHQFQDGQIVDGVGGGVCQSSSTLYNAVLMGGLKVVERHNHSLPVVVDVIAIQRLRLCRAGTTMAAAGWRGGSGRQQGGTATATALAAIATTLTMTTTIPCLLSLTSSSSGAFVFVALDQ